MEKFEIYKAFGTDFLLMTKHLLEKGDLLSEIENKKKALNLSNDKLRISIKPNLVTCSPANYGATTHTEIVSGIIEFLQEHNYKNITITEGSWVGDRTSEAFEYCGYNTLAKKYNVKIVDGQKDTYTSYDCCGMAINICDCYKNTDFLINVPVLKGHCQTRITCALKNMKGLLPNSEKRHFHSMGLHKPIAHLNTKIHQDYIVVDHICGDPDFEEGGSPLIRNCVMVAKDPVLVDAYTCSLLGYKISDVPYISYAEKLGVGSSDLNSLRIVTIEGQNSEDLPDTHKILEVNYAVEDVDSCSACYGMLIGALNNLKNEDLLEKLNAKISIGQGYRGKTGELGIGNCTKLFKNNIPGCPPSEEEIYKYLKNYILNQ